MVYLKGLVSKWKFRLGLIHIGENEADIYLGKYHYQGCQKYITKEFFTLALFLLGHQSMAFLTGTLRRTTLSLTQVFGKH